jgi:hypothetical protein
MCSANSIRKQEAEEEVLNRLAQVLSKDRILKAIVDKLNHRLATRTLPLQAELEHIRSQLEQAESSKRKYLDLSIELSFDENVESYFSDSPVAATAESFKPKQARKREKIEIAI